jgi:hypothetical protein
MPPQQYKRPLDFLGKLFDLGAHGAKLLKDCGVLGNYSLSGKIVIASGAKQSRIAVRLWIASSLHFSQ